jgi:hypothetical protein
MMIRSPRNPLHWDVEERMRGTTPYPPPDEGNPPTPVPVPEPYPPPDEGDSPTVPDDDD